MEIRSRDHGRGVDAKLNHEVALSVKLHGKAGMIRGDSEPSFMSYLHDVCVVDFMPSV